MGSCENENLSGRTDATVIPFVHLEDEYKCFFTAFLYLLEVYRDLNLRLKTSLTQLFYFLHNTSFVQTRKKVEQFITLPKCFYLELRLKPSSADYTYFSGHSTQASTQHYLQRQVHGRVNGADQGCIRTSQTKLWLPSMLKTSVFSQERSLAQGFTKRNRKYDIKDNSREASPVSTREVRQCG